MDLDEERVDAHRGSSSGEVGHLLGLPARGAGRPARGLDAVRGVEHPRVTESAQAAQLPTAVMRSRPAMSV